MTTDVNAAFDAERAEQLRLQNDRQATFEQRVKDGSMVNLGQGRYQVRDPGSWDDGEVFYLSGETLIPQHGLYVQEDGKVALYTAHPEWHELGNVIPGGVTDIDQVLTLGGVGFEVEQAPVRFFANAEWHDVPGQHVNYRNDTFAPLGVVGSVYKPFQPRQSFEFLEDVTGKYGLTWESAGLTAKNKLFVCVRLPEDIEIDIDGVKDIIRPHLAVLDSWDGNSSMTAVMTPWRIRCGNTERFAVRDAVSKWTVRHTTNALDRIEEARKSLGLAVKYTEAFKAEEQKLAQTDLEIDGFRSLIEGLWPEETPREEQTTRTRNANEKREDALEGMWGAQLRETGSNAYSAERVVTDYLDHVAPRRAVGDKLAAARATAILEGADDELKTRAHRQLLTLTNR